MGRLLRKFLRVFGLMPISDHERFRRSCVEFCDNWAGSDGFTAKTRQHFGAKFLDGNVFVVGDDVMFNACTVIGTIYAAPWTRGTIVNSCHFDKRVAQ